MHTIGLTGGIATGKSSVSKILKELGAIVIDADAIARFVVEPMQPAWRQVVSHFGNQVLLSDNRINRRMLADIVFSDAAERRNLENITHPAIWEEVKRQTDAAKAAGEQIIVLDVPLLFETHWQDKVDSIWVVVVDRHTQTERLMQRDSLDRKQAELRIAAQYSLEEKKKLADVVIDNSGDLESTRIQVQAAWQALVNIV